MTEHNTFNFKTEERVGRKKHIERVSNSAELKSEHSEFKARAMPKYTFFEVKLEPHKKILFQEFNLCTNKRQSSKKRSNSTDEKREQIEEDHSFRALPMPKF